MEKSQEWEWKSRARAYEEQLRRAKEELTLLEQREQELQDKILGLTSLGYAPKQFSYEVFQLQITRDSMPRARLEIDRAQRALDQFKDDARKEGVLPGWLR